MGPVGVLDEARVQRLDAVEASRTEVGGVLGRREAEVIGLDQRPEEQRGFRSIGLVKAPGGLNVIGPYWASWPKVLPSRTLPNSQTQPSCWSRLSVQYG